MHIYWMVDDILYGKQQMAAIKLEGLPQLCSHFDPIRWQEQNKHPHLSVWKLNEEQLKDWGEVATDIRKNINKKSENYKFYSEQEDDDEDEDKNRRQVPHSTRSSNSEGLLESQIRDREKRHAGITKSCKKRHMKELPVSTREAIVKMYLVDNVFQKDIAKFYKISAALVSKLVVEAQRNPQKNELLKINMEDSNQVKDSIKRVVSAMLENSVSIVNAEMVVKQVRRKEDIEVTIK